VPRSPQPLEFFIDRSLGRYKVAAALRAATWTLRTHHEVYGDRDEDVPDVEWLEYCGDEGFPVLTKDRRLRYRPAEIDAIVRFGVRAFVLTQGNFRGAEQAARFDRSRARIEEECAAPGPFVYAVHASRLELLYPA
jgi:hypothetical protein